MTWQSNWQNDDERKATGARPDRSGNPRCGCTGARTFAASRSRTQRSAEAREPVAMLRRFARACVCQTGPATEVNACLWCAPGFSTPCKRPGSNDRSSHSPAPGPDRSTISMRSRQWPARRQPAVDDDRPVPTTAAWWSRSPLEVRWRLGPAAHHCPALQLAFGMRAAHGRLPVPTRALRTTESGRQ